MCAELRKAYCLLLVPWLVQQYAHFMDMVRFFQRKCLVPSIAQNKKMFWDPTRKKVSEFELYNQPKPTFVETLLVSSSEPISGRPGNVVSQFLGRIFLLAFVGLLPRYLICY